MQIIFKSSQLYNILSKFLKQLQLEINRAFIRFFGLKQNSLIMYVYSSLLNIKYTHKLKYKILPESLQSLELNIRRRENKNVFEYICRDHQNIWPSNRNKYLCSDSHIGFQICRIS